MAGLLDDVLGWMQSPKRTQQMQGIGGSIQSGLLNIQDKDKLYRELQNKAFGDPKNPAKVTDKAALKDLTDMLMAGPMGIAPAGMVAKAPRMSAAESQRGSVRVLGESTQPPQAEALRLAQQRAALPIKKGGLGLPPNNTALDRAVAMGFDTDTNYIHMTNAPFSSINSTDRSLGIFSLPNDSATGYGSISMPFYLRGEPARSRDLREYTAKDVKSITGSTGKKATQKIDDAIEQTVPEKYWNDPADMADAFTEMQNIRMNLAAKLNYPAVKMQDEFNDSTVALLPGSGVRSRFAAFDPFRKTAATAAAAGLAAPDLMAGGVIDDQKRRRMYQLFPGLLAD
jgi:hypothetical protein